MGRRRSRSDDKDLIDSLASLLKVDINLDESREFAAEVFKEGSEAVKSKVNHPSHSRKLSLQEKPSNSYSKMPLSQSIPLGDVHYRTGMLLHNVCCRCFHSSFIILSHLSSAHVKVGETTAAIDQLMKKHSVEEAGSAMKRIASGAGSALQMIEESGARVADEIGEMANEFKVGGARVADEIDDLAENLIKEGIQKACIPLTCARSCRLALPVTSVALPPTVIAHSRWLLAVSLTDIDCRCIRRQ